MQKVNVSRDSGTYCCLDNDEGRVSINMAIARTLLGRDLDADESVTLFIDRWIPVEERLPEERGWYLISRPSRPAYGVSEAHWDGVHWHCYGEVIAWKPLPEPYQPA